MNDKMKRGLEAKKVLDRNGRTTTVYVKADDGGAAAQRNGWVNPAGARYGRGSSTPLPFTGEPTRTEVDGRVEYRTPAGDLHRIGAPAVIYRDANGIEKVEYWENGQCTYRSLPGLIHNGTMFYRYDGRLCRMDGPAVQRPDGRQEYWLWGVKMKSYADLQRGAAMGKSTFLTRYGALAAPPPTLSGIAKYLDRTDED
jgi:hypothetical protein